MERAGSRSAPVDRRRLPRGVQNFVSDNNIRQRVIPWRPPPAGRSGHGRDGRASEWLGERAGPACLPVGARRNQTEMNEQESPGCTLSRSRCINLRHVFLDIVSSPPVRILNIFLFRGDSSTLQKNVSKTVPVGKPALCDILARSLQRK